MASTAPSCPHCQKTVAFDNSDPGLVVACPHCRAQFVLPGDSTESAQRQRKVSDEDDGDREEYLIAGKWPDMKKFLLVQILPSLAILGIGLYGLWDAFSALQSGEITRNYKNGESNTYYRASEPWGFWGNMAGSSLGGFICFVGGSVWCTFCFLRLFAPRVLLRYQQKMRNRSKLSMRNRRKMRKSLRHTSK